MILEIYNLSQYISVKQQIKKFKAHKLPYILKLCFQQYISHITS